MSDASNRPGVDPRYLDSAFRTRLTVRVVERHSGVSEEPALVIQTIEPDERGIVLAMTEDHMRALVVVERRPPIAIYIPWLKLSLTGRRQVPAEALPEVFR